MFKFSVFGAVGVVVSLATLTGPASAQVLDPSTLHVGTGAGTSCSAGGCYVFPTASPNEVNGIGTGAHFDIFQQSNGGVTTTSPTLLIFAVPDGAAAPSLPSTAQLNPPVPPGSNVTLTQTLDAYGLGGPGGTAGKFSQGQLYTGGTNENTDIYTFLSTFTNDAAAISAFTNANNSYKDSNMDAAEAAVNPSVDVSKGYDIYLYEAETPLSANDLIDITGATLPMGTFIAAFAEESDKCPPNDTANHCPAVDVPFTEAGLTDVTTTTTTTVPEPTTLALLGGALAAMGFIRRRRKPL